MHAVEPSIYEDRTARIDDRGVMIRHYYFPFVSKFVPYSQIESVNAGIISWLSGRLRIWGTTDFSSWYSLDPLRPHKDTALVLTLPGHGAPASTPRDPDRAERNQEKPRIAFGCCNSHPKPLKRTRARRY